MAATWIEVGNTSLDDCEALTWSFGCTLLPSTSAARVEITSLVFMFELVPEPVWNTSIGKSFVVLAVGDPVGRRWMAVADLRRDDAQFGVDRRRRRLDQRQRAHLRALQDAAGDREVLHRPLGLRLVLGVLRDPHLAHRVVLDAVVRIVGTVGRHVVVFSHGATLSGRADGLPPACAHRSVPISVTSSCDHGGVAAPQPKTLRDMAVALAVLAVIAFGLMFVYGNASFSPAGPSDGQAPTADVTGGMTRAAPLVGFPVIIPGGLPDGWHPNSFTFTQAPGSTTSRPRCVPAG